MRFYIIHRIILHTQCDFNRNFNSIINYISHFSFNKLHLVYIVLLHDNNLNNFSRKKNTLNIQVRMSCSQPVHVLSIKYKNVSTFTSKQILLKIKNIYSRTKKPNKYSSNYIQLKGINRQSSEFNANKQIRNILSTNP